MNLHGIVAGKIARINPLQSVTAQLAAGGYTTNPDGSRTPIYQQPVMVSGQVQELTTRDLRQLEGLNIQGSQRAIYLTGEVDAVSRFARKGGDLLTLKDGSVWLTTMVLEQWPDWVKVSVTLQDGS